MVSLLLMLTGCTNCSGDTSAQQTCVRVEGDYNNLSSQHSQLLLLYQAQQSAVTDCRKSVANLSNILYDELRCDHVAQLTIATRPSINLTYPQAAGIAQRTLFASELALVVDIILGFLFCYVDKEWRLKWFCVALAIAICIILTWWPYILI